MDRSRADGGMGQLASESAGVMRSGGRDWREPETRDIVLPEFRFHTGEVMLQLRVRVTTLGHPDGAPVLVLHGTGGEGRSLLRGDSAASFSAPDNLLMPRAIASCSRMRSVMAAAPNRRTGCARRFPPTTTTTWSKPITACWSKRWASSGCAWCSAFQWAACSPGSGVRAAWEFFNLATNGGTLALQKAAPTREAADRWLAARRVSSRDALLVCHVPEVVVGAPCACSPARNKADEEWADPRSIRELQSPSTTTWPSRGSAPSAWSLVISSCAAA